MKTRPEVLSPAGSWAALKAAAAAGADAVYFGAGTFNARRNADNFSDEEIESVVSYCHGRGIKAYFTLNTVIFENELQKALLLAALVCAAGADAIILQDAGLCAQIRAVAPGMKLHASTQMSAHNAAGVRQLSAMGFSRVVLARELSLSEISDIAKSTDVELEVFVHGALCMSVSGQCYMSSFFGGQRSGNRGLCAQPCRLPFSCGGHENVLSLKDLSALERVSSLAEIGVHSLKIEGRMKRPEYVAAATAACAKAASGEAVTGTEIEELRAVFSRSGFTTGYLDGQKDRAMFGVRSREDTAHTAPVLKRISALYDNRELGRISVNFDFSLKSGGASLTLRDMDGNTASVHSDSVQKALNRPADEGSVKASLSKTGGTPFIAGDILVELEPGLMLPAAEINRMRREALSALLATRSAPKAIAFRNNAEFSTTVGKNVENKALADISPALRLRFFSTSQLPADFDFSSCALVYFPLREVAQGKAEGLLKKGVHVGVELPRGIFSGFEEIKQELLQAKALGIKDALCGNAGAVALAAEAGFMPQGDFGLNLTNSASVGEYARLGVQSFVLSFENPAANLRAIAQNSTLPCGVLAYGHLPLMLVRNCPARSFRGCQKSGCSITDRLGLRFTVVCNKEKGGAAEILNAKPLYLCDRKKEVLLPGIAFAQLYFTTETSAETAQILNAWETDAPFSGDYTRGLYTKPLE